MEIRELRQQEWALLKRVRLGALLDSPEAFSSNLEQEESFSDEVWQARAKGQTSYTVLAFDNQLPVGIAVGLPDPDLKRAFLVSMWVAQPHRGGDVATALVNEIASWARSSGFESLFLGVTKSNVRAEAFYRKSGFTTYTGEPIQHPGVDACGLKMVLQLN